MMRPGHPTALPPGGAPARRARRAPSRVTACVALLLLAGGCARWNTYYNANKAFRLAEHQRAEAIKTGKDEAQATTAQKKNYETAIAKAQKVLDEYPGHGLTDDALFLMAKSYFRLASYRMSLAKIDLLFVNFPKTPYEEEALYIQALDYLYVGDLANSTVALERLESRFPKSRFRADALRVRAENHFALEEWAAAREGFAAYLAAHPQAEDGDRIGLKLGQTLLELGDNGTAAERLRAVADGSEARETAFQARRDLARALLRLGRHEEAERELATLKAEAETYKAEGDIALIEVEGLMAQGRPEAAAPLLENMPKEWKNPEVTARAADLLARIYFRQWRLEDAAAQWREAVRNAKLLPDPEGTRALADHVRDYLAAQQRLKSAKPAEVPALKLNQANALLLGLGRPRAALEQYLEVAGLAADDSSAAARALYGAAVVYRDSLAAPDSAAVLLRRLESEFPDTPQAFALRSGGEGDLLAFLREQRDRIARADSARSAAGAAAPGGAASGEPLPGAAAADSLALPGAAAADSLALPGAAAADSLALPGAAAADSLALPGAAMADPLAAPDGRGQPPRGAAAIPDTTVVPDGGGGS